MPKTLRGIDPTNLEFDYKGKHFSVPVVDSLVLDDMSTDEIKKTLDEIPARLAYWKAMQVSLEREIEEAQEDFDLWFNEKYMEVDKEDPKKTEGWKKTKVMLEYPVDFRKQKKKLRDLQDTNKKINVLTSGYNNQIWTLREIARLTTAEIASLSSSSLKSSGSLADL